MNRLLTGDPAVDPTGPEGGVLGEDFPAVLAGFGAGALVALGGGLRLRRHGLRRQMNTGV